VPLTSELSSVVEADTCRMGENQPCFSFQTSPMSPRTVLEASDDSIIKIPN